jgi:hypothetical protein
MNRTEVKRELLEAVGRGRADNDSDALVDELLDDWQREAGEDAHAPAILALLRREFLDQAGARDETGRHELLLEHVLDRRIRRASVRSLNLGRRVMDGAIESEQARSEGEALMSEAKEIAPLIRELGDSEVVARLQRDLQEVTLEALYAIERKAMSRRLMDHQRDTQASSKVEPPHVS